MTTERPLISLVLLAYNQERFIRGAVGGAIAQCYSPLEIVLSDDASTDQTFNLMERMAATYDGPHRIVLNRNLRNLGIVSHVNRAFELASGELIVTAAGDDISLPSRVENTVELWLGAGQRPDGLVFGFMDRESGNQWRPPQAEEITAETIIERGTAKIRGASAAWSRRLFEYWGPLPENALAEDQIFAFRAVLCGGILRDDRSAVLYRTTPVANDLPGHAVLARKLWEMKRNLEFYRMYEADLKFLMAREPDQKGHLGGLFSRLQGRVEDLKAETKFLERSSRMDGLVYALALLTGRTWTRGSFRVRMGRALTVLRRLTLEGRRIGRLDENDHHGNRRREEE